MARTGRRFREVSWLGGLLVLVAILAWMSAAWMGRRTPGAPGHSSPVVTPSPVPAAPTPQVETDEAAEILRWHFSGDLPTPLGGVAFEPTVDTLLHTGPYTIRFSSRYGGTESGGSSLRVGVRHRRLLTLENRWPAILGQPLSKWVAADREPYLRLGNRRLGLPITEPGLGSWICGSTRVFEIADPARCVCDVERWGNFLYFTDLNGDGRDEIVFGDPRGGGFTVPLKSWLFPPVVLSFREDRFVVDSGLMRRPVPPLDELRRWALQVRGKAWKPTVDWSRDILHGNTRAMELEFPWSVPCVDSLQRLIYSGHADTARQFLHWCWPAGWRGEDEFWKGLLCSLSESAYWREVKAMNPAGSLGLVH